MPIQKKKKKKKRILTAEKKKLLGFIEIQRSNNDVLITVIITQTQNWIRLRAPAVLHEKSSGWHPYQNQTRPFIADFF